MAVGRRAKVLSDTYDGLDQDVLVKVVKIDGDDVLVDVEKFPEWITHKVKKSDLKQNKEFHTGIHNF